MTTSDSDNRVCEQCGAPLGYHTREGLCTRCIARFTLLEPQDNGQKAEDGSRRSEGGDRRSEMRDGRSGGKNLKQNPHEQNDAVPEAGAPMTPRTCSATNAVPEAGAPMTPRTCSATNAVPEAGAPIESAVADNCVDSTGVEPASKTRFGDYELLEEIAHGGMGVVYRARQVSLKRIVAVKMLLFGQFAGKAAFERFRAEAQTAAHLQHPNIVAVHEIGETDGQPYFSMDYVAGRNLAELVRDRPMPARQAAGYLRKIAQAVHYAHAHGVLHRDLKPANVLIDETDEPRITDFCLARQLAGDSGLTLTGQVLGSPNFMPPEQGTGKHAKVGPASDINGLGALLYYLLTARPPFLAETFEATLAQLLNTDPVAPRQLNPSIPRDLETLCLKCLEKDPARRYASAAELTAELDRFLRDEPILARSIGPTGKLWRWCRRKPALAAMAAAVVTLLLTVTAVSVASAWRIARARKGEQREAYYSNIALANKLIEEG
ncbi:MAG: protein kinase, partial [Verrucomicrobia bacterium]|nr:protein kinase [Verrucomicrobiota bacterium]